MLSVLRDRDDEAALLLLLLDAPSIGPRRVLDLLARCGSAQNVVDSLLASDTTPERVRTHLQDADIEKYTNSIERTYELGGTYKLWNDEDYPSNLRRWDGRPPVLFYKGDLTALSNRALALVGRVDPTEVGLESAHRFARKCVEHDITVISGLARGIDAASHHGALQAPPGKTYAVVGHGLDYAYPRENADLYATIPAHGGIISQFSTGVGPQRWTFPARNEVMCTLALGTVIIEGKSGCGSIIQADFSFKHGRPVFLLSKNLEAPDADWARKLVARGAHVIKWFDEVLEVVEKTLHMSRQEAATAAVLFDIGDSFQPTSAPDASPTNQLHGDPQTPQLAASTPGPVAALFDIDGVIIDSRAATAAALASVASRHLGHKVDPARVNPVGSPEGILASLGVPNPRAAYRADYDAALQDSLVEVRVFHEVVQRLRDLKASGIRIGAVTAQPRRRISRMVPREVRELFDVFLCHNDTGGKKDVGIRHALAHMQIPSQQAFFVGDSPSDMRAARKAGVKSVGVLWGFSSEEELKRSPSDILLESPMEISLELALRLSGPST
ncbi:HAD-IA family hydrolase [Nonomuraea sp. 3-1Str]|uniref:HAD-IA family hydrolase n=1 Tax=Nonomuraea sp. 3-1Str TaxID=2929801 RepID=UPI0028586451|nr:HAD-IA family hydrolase [Nonomuraea sp. 3-1Str]MDR8415245.1 HAD-IA family hydrolase [Nonomuraea sp. 3-1Str]